MTPNITKRADGRWHARITVDGKRKSFYGATKAEVVRKLRAWEEQKVLSTTFAKVADEWDSEHRLAVSYNSHKVYEVPMRVAIEQFGDNDISTITPQEISAFIKRIAATGYSKRTVKMYLTFFKLVYQYAIINNYCTTDPTMYVKIPSGLKTTKRELPNLEDIEIVKANVDAHFGFFPFFLMCTGLRRGEALALTYEDIDLDKRTIRVNKSLYWESNKPVIKSTKTAAGTRTVVILDALASMLPKDGKGYVFGGESPMTRSAFRRAWERYTKETDVQFTPHQLRHLFATMLYEAGIDEKLAQELMGHSTISVTRDVYTHIRKNRMDEAAAMLNEKLKI